MSVKVMSWVWEHSEAKGAARLALLAIADTCNDEGWCYAGQEHLARKTNTTPRSLRKHIRALEEAGELSVQVGGGITTQSGQKTNLCVMNGYRFSVGLPELTKNPIQGGSILTGLGTQGGSKSTGLRGVEIDRLTVSTKPSVKDTSPPKVTKAELDEQYDLIAELWGIPVEANGMIVNLQGMLFGSKKVRGAWNSSKLVEPVTIEELTQFVNACKLTQYGQPPQTPETLQAWVEKWRKSGKPSEPRFKGPSTSTMLDNLTIKE